MPHFSQRSLGRLETCHPDLQRLMHNVIKVYDITIIEGYRGEQRQNKAHREGKSQLRYPDSKHNQKPSLAVDIAPWPLDWNDLDAFNEMGWFVKGVAHAMCIPIAWGGDWKSFKDYPHFELQKG